MAAGDRGLVHLTRRREVPGRLRLSMSTDLGGLSQLRAAVPEDALCLSVLAMQVFLDTYATTGIRPSIAREVLSSYSQAEFRAAIASVGSRVMLAEVRDHLVGFARVTLRATHHLAPPGVQAELLRLYVHWLSHEPTRRLSQPSRHGTASAQ